MPIRSTLAHHVNNAIRPFNVQVVSGYSSDPAVKTFLPARRVASAARKAGMSVGDYIDQVYATPGATSATVEAMLKLGNVPQSCDVCEIGPGTGRFAVKIIDALHPRSYEIYESARDWLPTLRQLPNAVIRDCDGRTLAQTKDASIDLVHAQKVFVYTEFYTSVGYLEEMARVVRPDGVVAFDVLTEECLDERTVRVWVEKGSFYRPFPRDWIIGFMKRRGLEFLGSHFSPLPPGRAELLVFRRG